MSASSNTLRKPADFGEVSGFYHGERIAFGIVQELLEQFRQSIAGAAHAHDAPAAQHGERGRFVSQARRIAGKCSLIELGHAEGIVEIGHHAQRHRFGALAHQALVGAVDQRRGDLGRRLRHKAVRLVTFDDHVCFAK